MFVTSAIQGRLRLRGAGLEPYLVPITLCYRYFYSLSEPHWNLNAVSPISSSFITAFIIKENAKAINLLK